MLDRASSNIILGFMVLMQFNSTFVCADDTFKSLAIVSGLTAGAVATGMVARSAFNYVDGYVNYRYPFKCWVREAGLNPTSNDHYRAHESGGNTGSQKSVIEEERLKFKHSAGEIRIASKFNKLLSPGQNYQELVNSGFIEPSSESFLGEVINFSSMLAKQNDKKLEHDGHYEHIKNRLHALTDDELYKNIKKLDKLLLQKGQTLNRSRMLVLVAEVGAGKKKTMQALLKSFENHVQIEMRSLDNPAAIHCLQVYVESINRSLIRGNAEHTQILLESARKYFNTFDLYAMACRIDSHAMVQKLLDDGDVDIDCDFVMNSHKFTSAFGTTFSHLGVYGRFPIEVACAWGSSKVAGLLLQRGADIGATDLFLTGPSASRIRGANRDKILLARGVLPISIPLERYLEEDGPIPSQDQERLSCKYLTYLKQNHQNSLDSHYKWLAPVDTALDDAGLNQEDARYIALTMVNGLPSINNKKIAALQNQEADDEDEN